MKAIIVNHDRIYGSIGLYISLSLDSRDNFFRYLFSRTT
nr:photosystem II protein T [Chrysosplenium forrestii]UXE34685.1 photosystem II protein T [Chrysosplenium forrestii]